jgi:hypothetical protein
MNQPGAYQVGYMRRMFEKRNWQKLVPAQDIIAGDNPEGMEYKMAAISSGKDFLVVYIPLGHKTTINTSRLPAERLRAWWFNPRDGYCQLVGEFANSGSREFVPKSVGRGSDWVLIVDDASRNFVEPSGHVYRKGH